VVSYAKVSKEVNAVLRNSFPGVSLPAGVTPIRSEAFALIDVYDGSFSFLAALGEFTGLQLRMVSLGNGVIEVRPTPTTLDMRMRLSLQWNSNGQQPPQDDIAATLFFEGLQSRGLPGCVPLPSSQVLTGAQLHVDLAGVVSLTATTLAFSCVASFTAVTLQLDFPFAVDANSPEEEFNLSPSSYFEVIVSRDASVSDATVAQELVPVLIQDLEAPEFLSCPPGSTVVTSASQATGIYSWTLPAVRDNRAETVQPLRLYASYSAGEQDWTLVAVGAGVSQLVVATLALPEAMVADAFTGNASVAYSCGSGDGRCSLTAPALGPASPALRLRYVAQDLYGNQGACTFSVLVEDREAPMLVVRTDLLLLLPPGEATAQVQRDALITTLSDNLPLPVEFLAPATTALERAAGIYNIPVQVRDTWGNTVEKQARVRVLDLELPSIECPSSNEFTEAQRGAGAVVNFGSPRVSDNTDPTGRDLAVSASHPSGSSFAVGTTTVELSVEDASGNEASCNFTITVLEAATSASSGAADSTSTVGAGAGAGVLMVIVVVLALLVRHQRMLARRPADWNAVFAMIDQLKGQDGSLAPRELRREDVTVLEELGAGAFGLVYK
jgi:hypothetical protein